MTLRKVEVGQKWRNKFTGIYIEITRVCEPDVTFVYATGEFGTRSIGGLFRNFEPAFSAPRVHPKTELDGNPKDAIGSAKAPSMTVPTTIQALDGLAMLEGALKYGRHNYRAAPVRASVYVDALERHLKSWIEGEEIDPDSDLPHLAKARACLGIILDAQICGTLIDDRPPAKVPPGFFAECNKKAAALVAKYPNPVAPYTQVGAKQPVEVELDALKARTQPR